MLLARPYVLHGQGGEAGESLGPLTHHARDLVVDVARELSPLRRPEVIAEQRSVHRDHLHVRALGIHVRQPLLRREPRLGHGDATRLPIGHGGAPAIAKLEPCAVPIPAGVDGFPEAPRNHVRMDIDATSSKGGFAPLPTFVARLRLAPHCLPPSDRIARAKPALELLPILESSESSF